ncbi:MAG: GrpB family protein, partial [Proteobacteria bacterium]|nr:GrpB family protein [Pseudomonadota bacterium]
FLKMKRLTDQLFGDLVVRMEHFGSTSIPGIVAKPIIDMLGLVTSLSELDKKVEQGLPSTVTGLGENGVVGRRYFVFNSNEGLKGHLHLFEPGNREYEDRILFRDVLQQDLVTAKQYEQLKLQLCSEHGDDPTAYWMGKQAFVKNIVERARMKPISG